MARIPTDHKKLIKKIEDSQKTSKSRKSPKTTKPASKKDIKKIIKKVESKKKPKWKSAPKEKSSTRKQLVIEKKLIAEHKQEIRKMLDQYEYHIDQIDEIIEDIYSYADRNTSYYVAEDYNNSVLIYKTVNLSTTTVNTNSIFQRQEMTEDKEYVILFILKILPVAFDEAREKIFSMNIRSYGFEYPKYLEKDTLFELYYRHLRMQEYVITSSASIARVLEEIT